MHYLLQIYLDLIFLILIHIPARGAVYHRTRMDQQQEALLDTRALFAPKKGKQATKGQKQIYEDNKETIKFYSIMAAAPLLLKLLFASPFSTTLNLSLTLFAVLIQGFAIGFMYYMAKPVLSGPSQVVVDGGTDLNMKSGLADYTKDMIITTSLCTCLSIYSNGFWCLWLWLPAFFTYKFWTSFIAPWIFAPAPEGPPPEVADKKRRKMERKMARSGYR